MAKLFVSYSRIDSVAARKLIEAFKTIDQEVWVDWESIPPAVDWLEQIFRGIEEADAFIFLISSDSIASEVCKVEIGRAALNNKRIIPIVLRDVKPSDTLESIRKLNWTYMRETDNFEEGLAKVKTAIELDLDWLEEHRRLQVRSLEWERKKDPSLLLRGRDLRNARHMLATATSKDPIPTDLQKAFIQHSFTSERNRTIAWVTGGLALLIMTVLAIIAVNQSNEAQKQTYIANTQQNFAEAKSTEAINNANLADQNAGTAQANENIARTQEALASESEIRAKAGQNAARAQIYQGRPGELYISTLLAIDSMQRSPSDAAEEILRRNISLLPLPVKQVSQAGKINSIAFNRDGSIFVTGSADGTACAWEVKNGNKLFCTSADSQSVNTVAFSPDGSFIATGDQAGLVQILDPANGSVQHTYQRVPPKAGTVEFVDIKSHNLQADQKPLEIPVRSLKIRPPNGQQVAAAYDDGEIPVFNPATGNVSSPLFIGGRPEVTGFSPNGFWFAAGSNAGIVTIWHMDTKEKPSSGSKHPGGVLTMAFDQASSKLATGGNDNTAAISSLRTGEKLVPILNQNSVRAIAFSPDGSWVVTGSDDHRIRIWDALTGKERLGMSQDGIVNNLAVSPNGQWIATTGDDRTARVWNAATGAEIFQIPLNASGSVLAFGTDGRYLVTSDERGATSIWDLSVMVAPEQSLQHNGIAHSVQYSPSGDRLAIAYENQVWLLVPDSSSGLATVAQGAPAFSLKSNVKSLIFSPDSKWLGALTEGNEVAVYDIVNQQLKRLAISGVEKSIAFSPDSTQFVASDAAGKIQAWNIVDPKSTGASYERYPQVVSLAVSAKFLAIGSKDKINVISIENDGSVAEITANGDNILLALNHDGSFLASADSSGQIKIWKYQAGQFVPAPPLVKEQPVSLAFNPAGSLLAVGTATNVLLIDTTTGQEIARIPHVDVVSSVSFSGDGNILVTASSKVLQFWEVAKIQPIRTGNLIPKACSRLIENLGKNQWSAFFPGEDYRTLCDKLPVPQ
ncbi:MAG TPA: TIR domain-containing protein [Anaerolineales bacterium]|nr:TIR domain-containing protein [Anaerolineales bacterium]